MEASFTAASLYHLACLEEESAVPVYMYLDKPPQDKLQFWLQLLFSPWQDLSMRLARVIPVIFSSQAAEFAAGQYSGHH